MSVYDSRSSANVGAGDLTGAAAAISGSQTTCVAAMDSKYRLNIADQNRTRTEHAEVPANGTERRDAANSDVIATKEVEVCAVMFCTGVLKSHLIEWERLWSMEGQSLVQKVWTRVKFNGNPAPARACRVSREPVNSSHG